MLLSSMMWFTTVPPLTPQLLFFHWIKKRLLTEWTGISCSPHTHTLSTMGFSPSFISWVNLFYNHVQSAVNVNGYLSPFFSLSRGVRQGCPLSPLLNFLASEVLVKFI